MSIFKDKILLITGGTGSFGNAVLRRFLDSDIREIRIFSRDEKKQDDMRHFLQANRPDVSNKVKFYIGNVRNREAVDFAMNGVDYVFSAAALKQVPSCEFYPMEAVRTNVEGTNNVLLSAIAHGVKNVVVLSTDKAAYPTPENPDADMTLEDTTEADLQAEQYAQPETLLGQHTVSLGTCVFQQKKIACWGDSITFGYGYSDEAQLTNGGQIMDISGWTYPDTLQYYTGMDVYNLGVSGETSYEIATREGGLTMFVAKNVTVKAGKSVEISIVDVDGNSVMLDNFNGYGGDNNQTENLVYINDQLFQLEKRNEKLYIKTYGNTQKGNVKLKKGMQVVTQAAHDVNADILVLQMGSNGGWDSYDELIAQYQAMIEKSGTQCYIIIGDTDNPTEAYDSEQYESDIEVGTKDNVWETALREAFGEHFINMRAFMIEYGLETAGLDPTEQDLDDLANGRVPEQLKDDYTHFNSYGYYAMGAAVYQKGVELGYW